jgi:hypothetical protein
VVFPYLTRTSCFSSIVVMLWCPSLVHAADWWAKAPLSARVALLAGGNRSFVAHGLPCTILCTVYEQPSLRLFLWYKLQSVGPQFFHPVLASSSSA